MSDLDNFGLTEKELMEAVAAARKLVPVITTALAGANNLEAAIAIGLAVGGQSRDMHMLIASLYWIGKSAHIGRESLIAGEITQSSEQPDGKQ